MLVSTHNLATYPWTSLQNEVSVYEPTSLRIPRYDGLELQTDLHTMASWATKPCLVLADTLNENLARQPDAKLRLESSLPVKHILYTKLYNVGFRHYTLYVTGETDETEVPERLASIQ